MEVEIARNGFVYFAMLGLMLEVVQQAEMPPLIYILYFAS